MNKHGNNALLRLEKPTVNYPLLAVLAVLLLSVAGGIVFAAGKGEWVFAILFGLIGALILLAVLIEKAWRRRRDAVDDRKFIRWNSALPEVQQQDVNVEVHELARLLGVEDDALNDLLSAYIVAEDLALRQIQQEEDLPLMRHVAIGGSAFDGIMVDRDLITCIEVSFIVTPDVRQERIEAMIKKVVTARHNLAEHKSRLRLKLMLVLVTQITKEEEDLLRGKLMSDRFAETPVDIDIRMLDFEMLQRLYVGE
ncbi:MAG: hypothetical protein HS105_10835 [Chloracidobacterium sp.]|nr:hypothetical protein [Chloracidobacterium sp.]MCC6824617.1 hypothetical protein [Acidobacteriota bacterium]MCO5332856.1 hypothetical protein [Pyrinomonadaceae bacterium]